YSSIRFSRSQQMGYDIPVPDGEYTVRLHFAEVWFGATGGGSGGVGSRVFDVRIEGQLVEDNLDVFAEVGADAELVQTHTVQVSGGVLDIDFSSLGSDGGTRHPIINAIEVLGSGNSSIFPTVNAGDNQTVTLPTDTIVLSGAGNDPDGGEIRYEWSQQSGPSIATLSNVMTPNLTATGLVEGDYVFRLTVTDDEDDMAYAEVRVTVSPQQTQVPDQLWLEAECAIVGSNWNIINDETTSGGQYLLSPTGNNFNSAPSSAESHVSFNFAVEAGTYKLFALVDTPNGDNDSFWVRANGGTWLKWNYILGDGSFNWRQLHDRERRTVFVTLDLNEGLNTIDFAHREQGVGLDKIFITKTTDVPSGLGGNDFNCGQANKNEIGNTGTSVGVTNENLNPVSRSNTISENLISGLNLYPNPSSDVVYISFSNDDSVIEAITIHDFGGRLVGRFDGMKTKMGNALHHLSVSGLRKGIYLLSVTTETGAISRHKLVVQKD
ncbi:MAG: T9SS type A sorting domain-containing protein, partial [Pricia sp.]|nr:T9SS type A sorting domain-containing protein [Pricia sp.]